MLLVFFAIGYSASSGSKQPITVLQSLLAGVNAQSIIDDPAAYERSLEKMYDIKLINGDKIAAVKLQNNEWAAAVTDCGTYVGACFSGYGWGPKVKGFPKYSTVDQMKFLKKDQNNGGKLFTIVPRTKGYQPKQGDLWIRGLTKDTTGSYGHIIVVNCCLIPCDASLGDHAPRQEQNLLPGPSFSIFRAVQSQNVSSAPKVPICPVIPKKATKAGFSFLAPAGNGRFNVFSKITTADIGSASYISPVSAWGGYAVVADWNRKIVQVKADGSQTMIADLSDLSPTDDPWWVSAASVEPGGKFALLQSNGDFSIWKFDLASKKISPLLTAAQLKKVTGLPLAPGHLPATWNLIFNPGGSRFAVSLPTNQILYREAGTFAAVSYVFDSTGENGYRVGPGAPLVWLSDTDLQVQPNQPGTDIAYKVGANSAALESSPLPQWKQFKSLLTPTMAHMSGSKAMSFMPGQIAFTPAKD